MCSGYSNSHIIALAFNLTHPMFVYFHCVSKGLTPKCTIPKGIFLTLTNAFYGNTFWTLNMASHTVPSSDCQAMLCPSVSLIILIIIFSYRFCPLSIISHVLRATM